MSWWDRLLGRQQVVEAAPVVKAPSKPPARAGYEWGIGQSGINEVNQGSTGNDRRSTLSQLYEAYLACPWSWAATNAIARTITAGGLVTDFDADDGEGDQEVPPKPANVLALERLFGYCNEREDVRQLLRGAITDLLVFGDAFIEVVWLGDIPVALYSLDAPSMFPVADEHGRVTSYAQVTELGQRATFEPRDVIHISMDSPRSNVFGVSPTQAAMLPITAWLFAAATLKEIFRKGNPPSIHTDFPAGTAGTEINRWLAMYAQQNIGPRNIGTPITTKGGATVNELKQGSIAEYLSMLDQKRDEILSAYGTPPAEAGVIESGNIGGGTGESQRKSFLTNTCDPIAQLVIEKLQFAIAVQGFGVEGWKLKFSTVDMRDSKTIEDIRDLRIRNGSWTINKARAEIGEPPVEGGDDAVIIDRAMIVLVRDLEASSQAGVAAKLKGTALEPEEPKPGKAVEISKPDPEPVPPALQGFAGQANPAAPPAVGLPAPGSAKQPPAETQVARDWKAVSEAWTSQYRIRRRQALDELPTLTRSG